MGRKKQFLMKCTRIAVCCNTTKQRVVQVECHFITHIRNEMLMGNHSPDEFTSAHSNVALEMHFWTVSKPEHGKQCGIRYTGTSIVYEFRHSHFHRTALQSKQITISGLFPLLKAILWIIASCASFFKSYPDRSF